MANPSGANQTLVKIYDSVLNAIRVHVVDFFGSVSVSASTHTRPSVTNVSSTILASNTSRKSALITNNGGVTVYLKLGATAVVNQGIPLGPNDSYAIGPSNLWTGSIMAVKATATALAIDVFEGT